MSVYRHMRPRGLAGLMVLVSAISVHAGSAAQSVTADETVRSVHRMLERLPYYGVFDYIVFRVNGGTVYLAGVPPPLVPGRARRRRAVGPLGHMNSGRAVEVRGVKARRHPYQVRQ
jgi:hypothetical protein